MWQTGSSSQPLKNSWPSPRWIISKCTALQPAASRFASRGPFEPESRHRSNRLSSHGGVSDGLFFPVQTDAGRGLQHWLCALEFHRLEFHHVTKLVRLDQRPKHYRQHVVVLVRLKYAAQLAITHQRAGLQFDGNRGRHCEIDRQLSHLIPGVLQKRQQMVRLRNCFGGLLSAKIKRRLLYLLQFLHRIKIHTPLLVSSSLKSSLIFDPSLAGCWLFPGCLRAFSRSYSPLHLRSDFQIRSVSILNAKMPWESPYIPV